MRRQYGPLESRKTADRARIYSTSSALGIPRRILNLTSKLHRPFHTATSDSACIDIGMHFGHAPILDSVRLKVFDCYVARWLHPPNRKCYLRRFDLLYVEPIFIIL